jgi:glycosyltransferase involved in cell wall biosynthesis
VISVVIPVYNGAQFIAAAIRSVLNQTLAPAEIIVVDDGSSDASAEIAASLAGVRTLRLPHRGASTALNAGLAAVTGDLLAFLDADDLWAPDMLASEAAALDEAPATDAVFGRVVPFNDPEGRITDPLEIARGLPSMVGASKIAMLVRRRAFLGVGEFDESMEIADFAEWYPRALRRGVGMRHLDKVVAFRRIHRSNTTLLKRNALHRDYFRIARSAIAEAARPETP